MVRELSKLNPQGHVHAIELYAAINVIRRCPPGPILAILASRPCSCMSATCTFAYRGRARLNRLATREVNLSEIKRPSLVKPTLQTRFHIDFDWFRGNDQDWRVYLHSNLCPEHQKIISKMNFEGQVDWVGSADCRGAAPLMACSIS